MGRGCGARYKSRAKRASAEAQHKAARTSFETVNCTLSVLVHTRLAVSRCHVTGHTHAQPPRPRVVFIFAWPDHDDHARKVVRKGRRRQFQCRRPPLLAAADVDDVGKGLHLGHRLESAAPHPFDAFPSARALACRGLGALGGVGARVELGEER
eukprot:328425-Prymnesium_polylepis.1